MCLREALHNLAACRSHKLEGSVETGVTIISSRPVISQGLNPDEMLKIVVQPIAFKEDHLLGAGRFHSVPFRSVPFGSVRFGLFLPCSFFPPSSITAESNGADRR